MDGVKFDRDILEIGNPISFISTDYEERQYGLIVELSDYIIDIAMADGNGVDVYAYHIDELESLKLLAGDMNIEGG